MVSSDWAAPLITPQRNVSFVPFHADMHLACLRCYHRWEGNKELSLRHLLHLITRHTTSGTQPADRPLHYAKLAFCVDGVQLLSTRDTALLAITPEDEHSHRVRDE
jgi:hypothetical protein